MLEKLNKLGNYEIGKGYGIVSLNPKIYSLDNIKKAAKSTDDIFILDGDIDSEILIEFISKQPKKTLLKFAKLLCKDL